MRGGLLRALALPRQVESPLPFPAGAAILLLHMAGTLLVARLAHWPLPLTVLVLAGLLLVVTSRQSYALRFTHYTYALTPLALPYLTAALRILIALAARAQGQAAGGGLTVPEPWGGWLNLNWAYAFGALWALAARLPAARRGAALTLGAAGLAFGWAGWLYFHNAPAGVTGSDPYAYVQMAVDLAERGTLLHRFPLAQTVRALGLPLFPVVHVGYRLPGADNLAATVWPPGFSALLAGAYRLLGERGLYVLNPALGLAALAATAWLAARLLPHLKDLALLTCNGAEGAALCQCAPPADSEQAVLTAKELVALGVETAIVTLAESGVGYATGEASGHIAALQVEVADLTGAGDAFTAALLFGLLNDVPIDEAVRLGVSAAAITLRSRQTVVPELTEELLYEQLM